MEAKALNKSKKRKGGSRRRQGGGRPANPIVTSAEARSFDYVPGSTLQRIKLGDDMSEAVLYEKTTTMEFSFPLKAVYVKEAANKPSAAVYWQLPGMDLTSASAEVCHVNWAEISLVNHSDYRLFARMQKPMGFKGDPSALAMWEPYGEKNTAIRIVEPGASTSYNIKYGSTTFMGPHQTFVGGKEALHLCSFAFSRDAIDKHGNAPALSDEMKESLVVTGKVKVMYRAASSANGEDRTIGVIAYDTTDHLDHVDPGPVSTCTFEDAYTKKAETIHFKRTDDGKPYLVARTIGTGDLDPVFPALDQNTLYRLPGSIIGVAMNKYTNVTADVIKYSTERKRWELGKFLILDSETTGAPTFYNADVDWGYVNCFSPYERLTPISYSANSSVKVKGAGKPVRSLLSKQGLKGQFFSESKFAWLPSFTTILRVVKDLIIYAAATGLLVNNLDELPNGPRPDTPGEGQNASDDV